MKHPNNRNRVLSCDWMACKDWSVGEDRIQHCSGRYFSVIGVIDGQGNDRIMIDQPEIGMLGFIVTGGDEDRSWLSQYKPEPGNVELYQHAPTVQATVSNYERVHQGRRTPFLEEFLSASELLSDVESSEQGDRFWNKFNRNVKRDLPQGVSIPDSVAQYQWLSTLCLKHLLRESFQINTDARSVIVSGRWDLLASPGKELFDSSLLSANVRTALMNSYRSQSASVLRHVTARLSVHDGSKAIRVGLSQLDSYTSTERGMHTVAEANLPELELFDVLLPEREVEHWQQPLLVQRHHAACLLLLKIENGIASFLVSERREPGFLGRTELGPTLQIDAVGRLECQRQENEIDSAIKNSEVLLSIDQSDEGGRFYQNICTYTVAITEATISTGPHDHWLTAKELELLSTCRGKLTNELRTTLSALLGFS